MRRLSFLFFTIVIFLSFLSGCKGKQVESDYPESSLIDTFEVKLNPNRAQPAGKRVLYDIPVSANYSTT
ncbi:hypothetical protein [Barnesiella intestinihominis]|uniref:hypothetical protein n=1 Tax=Barnesiella intestinihominis TaxID=487174 RepID=UPI003970BEB3